MIGFGGPGEVVEDIAEPFYAPDHVAGVWWDICGANISGPDEAEELTRELLARLTLPGPEGRALSGALSTWWGPPLPIEDFSPGQMRVDLHEPSGRARVTWLPTGEVAVETGVRALPHSISVLENSQRTPLTVSGEEATVTITGAIRAILQYVETGERPATLGWRPTV